MDDLHILPGAFGDVPKKLPLVIYEKDGTRKVVGEATIVPDDNGFHISGAVTDPEMKKLVQGNIDPKFGKKPDDPS